MGPLLPWNWISVNVKYYAPIKPLVNLVSLSPCYGGFVLGLISLYNLLWISPDLCVFNQEEIMWVVFWAPFQLSHWFEWFLSEKVYRNSLFKAEKTSVRWMATSPMEGDNPSPGDNLAKSQCLEWKCAGELMGTYLAAPIKTIKRAGKRDETGFYLYQCQISKFYKSIYLNCLLFLI